MDLFDRVLNFMYYLYPSSRIDEGFDTLNIILEMTPSNVAVGFSSRLLISALCSLTLHFDMISKSYHDLPSRLRFFILASAS